MIESIDEYVIKPEYRARFELTFGPGGAWDHMFSRCEGYRGTTVLRDTETPERFLVVNLWDSVEHRDKALKKHEEALSHVRTDLNAWTESEMYQGVFTVLVKAIVRPRHFSRQSSKERRY
ncbi:MAG TPA: hypothetical protein DEH00_00735 [Candidatus Marinimicrobia bacterium]|nr:hypothetical protein [Candidatus Neomarinimicrobiota bacterium]